MLTLKKTIMFASFTQIKNSITHLRIGDWLVIAISSVLVVYLFQHLWSHEHAAKVQIRVGDKVHATYDLNLARHVQVTGALGEAVIHIAHGKARFAKSPCHNQYCVHQGWLNHSGQAAICLPNQISLELIGEKKPYDTLNY
jgi:hypothetical protein